MAQSIKVAMLCIVQVSSRIWEHVIVSLHPDSFKDVSAFIAWLPSDQPEGKAGAASALLANLAQVSATALQVHATLLHLSHYAVETDSPCAWFPPSMGFANPEIAVST